MTALESVRQELEARSNPTVPERLALAEAYFRLAVQPETDPDAGVGLLRLAIAADPFHPKLYFHLGRLLHRSGDPQAAVIEYRTALRRAVGSHRTYIHLALALNDLGPEDQKLGLEFLDASQAAEAQRLRTLLEQLDHLLAKRLGPERSSEKKPGYAVARVATSRPWRGLWKLLVLSEMAKAKPAMKVANRHMDDGKALIDGPQGVGEYALAAMFFVLDGPKSCRQVSGWLREKALSSQKHLPAVALAQAVCELGDVHSPEEFVERASAGLKSSLLPPELVCCLHYSWFGLSTNDPVKALELLDRYPETYRSMPCFRELRLAILDHHAAAAWSADRVERAEILWREAMDLDPCRVPLAHNLAIAATRIRATDKYGAAWERAAEVRYLLAASAGDLRVALDDRVSLHRSFAQQSRLRYAPESSRDPNEAEIQAWLDDREALDTWLREGALEFLNSRLRFRSPLHQLGLAQDCSDEDAESAKATLLAQFELCLGSRGWAGARVFLDLVEKAAARAAALARDFHERKRDRYFESEEPAAETTAREAVQRGLLMFRMVRLAASKGSSQARRRAGLEAVRYLLSMPWRELEPIAKQMGALSRDVDLMPVFLSYVGGLVLGAGSAGGDDRIATLDDCIRFAPRAAELRLVRCRLLLDAKRNHEAYLAALDALPVVAGMKDRHEAGDIESQLIICVDNAAMAEIPANLLSPTKEQLPRMLEEGRRVLARFPRAGGLRLLMARYLIATSVDDNSRPQEAARILEEGLELFLTDKQIAEARELLEKAGSRSKAPNAVKEIRTLMESASSRARAAMDKVNAERTPANLQSARAEIEEALSELARAEEIATEAGLKTAAEKAREAVAGLRTILESLEN